MKPADNLEKSIKKDLHFSAGAELHDQMLNDVLNAQEKSRKANSALTRPNLRRQIMKSPFTKLTAASAIIGALLIMINHFGNSGTNVVWGEVVRNIEASSGFIYRMRQIYNDKKTGTNELNMMAYGSARYGFRLDGYNDDEIIIQTFATLSDGVMTSVDHVNRTYYRTAIPDNALVEIENMEPKEAVRKYLSAEYTKLGRRTIDGVEAEGIEINRDPQESKANFQVDSCVIQLWVAVDTGLPILVEVNTVGKNETLEVNTIQDNFQWNVELEANEFEPNIPKDYTLVEVETDADSRTTYKTTEQKASIEAVEVKIQKWRFVNKEPERGYILESEDGQTVATIPESWADDPGHAVKVKEELDLQKQQGNRDLVAVTEIEVNGQLDYRILIYEHNLSDGRTVKISDFDPDDTSLWTVIGERRKELSQLLRERYKQEEKGQELATTEEKQVYGRVFTFEKRRFVLSDGTKVTYSIGRIKDY